MNPLPQEEKNLAVPAASLFWEARVSEFLGVPRKTLAALRAKHLQPGVDFERRENNAVALTPLGMSKLEALLKTEGAGAEQTPSKPAVPAGPPVREAMTVDRVPANPALLVCQSETRAVIVVVRVRDNTNFAAGMRLEAIESADGIWQFRNRLGGDESTVGRLPRQKGKW